MQLIHARFFSEDFFVPFLAKDSFPFYTPNTVWPSPRPHPPWCSNAPTAFGRSAADAGTWNDDDDDEEERR
jgi:hypothetical protein